MSGWIRVQAITEWLMADDDTLEEARETLEQATDLDQALHGNHGHSAYLMKVGIMKLVPEPREVEIGKPREIPPPPPPPDDRYQMNTKVRW